MSIAGAMSRNSLLLGAFAALTTAIIAWTFQETKDDIVRAEREAEARQLLQLFPADTHDNNLIDDRIEMPAKAALLGNREDRAGYLAKKNGKVVGVILPATARDGYSGDIRLLVGVNTEGTLTGVRVVSHRETPGLGDGIDLKKSDWILDFSGRSLGSPPPDEWTVKKNGGVFDQFTGATITPQAVVIATRKALEYVQANQAKFFGPIETPTDAQEVPTS